MASLTWCTWVWVSWWWTRRPGVLRFMGLQRVRHDWVIELNWTELKYVSGSQLCKPDLKSLYLCVVVLLISQRANLLRDPAGFSILMACLFHLVGNHSSYPFFHSEVSTWRKPKVSRLFNVPWGHIKSADGGKERKCLQKGSRKVPFPVVSGGSLVGLVIFHKRIQRTLFSLKE